MILIESNHHSDSPKLKVALRACPDIGKGIVGIFKAFPKKFLV